MTTKDEALKLARHVMHNQGDIGVDEWIATEKAINEALNAPLAEQNIRNATLDEIALFIENYVEGYDRDYRNLGLELADEIQARKT